MSVLNRGQMLSDDHTTIVSHLRNGRLLISVMVVSEGSCSLGEIANHYDPKKKRYYSVIVMNISSLV